MFLGHKCINTLRIVSKIKGFLNSVSGVTSTTTFALILTAAEY